MSAAANSESESQSRASDHVDLTIEPPCSVWPALLKRARTGSLFGREIQEWRSLTRRELGIPADRPISATGHQAAMGWHPGILAKYIAVDAFARAHGLFAVNVLVDHDSIGSSAFRVPVRDADGWLVERFIFLTGAARYLKEPLSHEPAFDPPSAPLAGVMNAPSFVHQGVARIYQALRANRHAPNAALQIAGALTELMRERGWVRPMKLITASGLMKTSLGKAMVRAMVDDPRRCAEAYNRAVASFPGAAPSLDISRERVELPVWRVDERGRRRPAYDHDAKLAGHSSAAPGVGGLQVFPRALLLTALVRLAVCDLFIHGTGGAAYDRATEQWMRDWLKIELAPMAVVTADVRLPLLEDDATAAEDASWTRAEARRVWHDPTLGGNGHPSAEKRRLLQAVDSAPRNSVQRRQAFLAMHERLAEHRREHHQAVDLAQQRAAVAARAANDKPIAARRDWPFPLYPPPMIDELRAAIERGVQSSSPTTGT